MNEWLKLQCPQHLKPYYRKYLIIFLFVIIFLFSGIGFWAYKRHINQDHLIKAANAYETLLVSFQNPKPNGKTEALTKLLLGKYSNTPYGTLAALQQAKITIQQNKLSQAESYLNWALHHERDVNLLAIIRIRLARVLLEEKKTTQAFELLDGNTNLAFKPLIFEEKGDAFFQLGKKKAALDNYLIAKKLFSKIAFTSFPLLNSKINTLTQQDKL